MSFAPPPPATQSSSLPLAAAAAAAANIRGRKKGVMALQPSEDELKMEIGVGVSNGAAISLKTQENTRKALDASSRLTKPKKPSKNERKTVRAAQRSQQPQEDGSDADPTAVASSSRNYGDLPVTFFQTSASPATASPRAWMEVSELVPDAAGRAVVLRGWAQAIRSVGKKLVFLILRDRLATVQCLVVRGESAAITDQMVRFARDLPKESFIEVEGIVSLPSKPLNYTTQEVEISVRMIYCISRSTNNLPFNFEDAARTVEEVKQAECRGDRLPNVTLETRLEKRTMDLRTPMNQAIFQIQSVVACKFIEFMLSKGFMGIHTPKITSGISEGGSSVFKLNYVNGQIASLAQSPQLYKQMAINAGLKKVFEVGSIFRAEKSHTHRHLCEYVGLHVEMEIKEHYFEVCDVLGELFVELFDYLAVNCRAELDIIKKHFPCKPLEYHRESLKLSYAEGIQMLKESGFEIEQYDDLSTKAEKTLGQLVHDKYNTDFFILYEFPLAVRPFYTMPCLDKPKYSNSFDAFIRGEEVVSGSQRIHCYELLLERIRKCGIDKSTLKAFTESFQYGAPPRGGFGAGLERVVMLYCGLSNIRLASLFPRDPQRLTP